jgi:hypothetical protein
MYSDTCPTSFIRGKCRVMHRDYISDIEAYKRVPDSFYFHQVRVIQEEEEKNVLTSGTKLYDRYLRRYYDVIPTDKIRNAPGLTNFL